MVSRRNSILSLPCHEIPDCPGYSCNFLPDRAGGHLRIKRRYGANRTVKSTSRAHVSWNIETNQEGQDEHANLFFCLLRKRGAITLSSITSSGNCSRHNLDELYTRGKRMCQKQHQNSSTNDRSHSRPCTYALSASYTASNPSESLRLTVDIAIAPDSTSMTLNSNGTSTSALEVTK